MQLMQPEEIIILLIKLTNNYVKSFLIILGLFSWATTQAEIFKCTNANGAVYYNDKPCPVKDKQKTMKAEKDVVNGYVPKIKVMNKPKTKTTPNSSNKRSKSGSTDKSHLNKVNKTAHKNVTNKKHSSSTANQDRMHENSPPTNQPISAGSHDAVPQEPKTDAEKERLFIDMHAGETADDAHNFAQ